MIPNIIKFSYDSSTGNFFVNTEKAMEKYQVLEQNIIDGKVWYSVHVSDDVSWWLFYTFQNNIDFRHVNQLKGTWVDMTGETLALLKLKWS